MAEMTLMVLAAGMGSRYGGLKQIDPVGPSGETILDYSVYDAIRAGFDHVVFVIREEMASEFADTVSARFSDRISVSYAFQKLDDLPEGKRVPEGRQKPWGTAHAVLAARDQVHNPFAVLNADDFYGRDAFTQITEFFRSLPRGSDGIEDYAMVGFTLRNTLSHHGSVARGICATDRDGYLTSVEELTALVPTGDGGARSSAPGQIRDLTGDEVASMNFWGFTPAAFPQFWEVFATFLENPGDPLKKEFYIPTAVDQLIESRSARVSVLQSNADWFGVTYREDRETVMASLRRLVRAGEYPSSLWD